MPKNLILTAYPLRDFDNFFLWKIMSDSPSIFFTFPQNQATEIVAKIYNGISMDTSVRLFVPMIDGQKRKTKEFIEEECSQRKSKCFGLNIEIDEIPDVYPEHFNIIVKDKNSPYAKSLQKFTTGMNGEISTLEKTPPKNLEFLEMSNRVGFEGMTVVVNSINATQMTEFIIKWINSEFQKLAPVEENAEEEEGGEEEEESSEIELDDYIDIMFGNSDQKVSTPSVHGRQQEEKGVMKKVDVVAEMNKKLRRNLLGFDLEMDKLNEYVTKDGRISMWKLASSHAKEIKLERFFFRRDVYIENHPYYKRLVEMFKKAKVKASTLNWDFDTLKRIVTQNKEGYHLFCLKIGKTLVSYAMFTEETVSYNGKSYPFMYIHFICGDQRFTGVGVVLMNMIKQTARDLEKYFIELQPIHPGLVKFYSELEFKPAPIAEDFADYKIGAPIYPHMIFNVKLPDVNMFQPYRLTRIRDATALNLTQLRSFFEPLPEINGVQKSHYISSIPVNPEPMLGQLKQMTGEFFQKMKLIHPTPTGIASKLMALKNSDGALMAGIEFSKIDIHNDTDYIIFIHSFYANIAALGVFSDILDAIKTHYPDASAIDCDVPSNYWIGSYFIENGFVGLHVYSHKKDEILNLWIGRLDFKLPEKEKDNVVFYSTSSGLVDIPVEYVPSEDFAFSSENTDEEGDLEYGQPEEEVSFGGLSQFDQLPVMEDEE